MKQKLSNLFNSYWIPMAIILVIGTATSTYFLSRPKKEPIPFGFTWQTETRRGVESFNLPEASRLTVMQTSGGVILQNKDNRDDVRLLDPHGKWYYRARTFRDKFRVVSITGETKTADVQDVISVSNDPIFCDADNACSAGTVYLLLEDRTVIKLMTDNRQYVVINP